MSASIWSPIKDAGTYLGEWNASTNSPVIKSGTGAINDFYQVAVAGTTSIDGVATWEVGDYIWFTGLVWTKVANKNIGGAKYILPETFGAIGNSNGEPGNGANDTEAMLDAFDAARAIDGTVFLTPGKKYRVTSGYNNNSSGSSVTLLGGGVDLFSSTAVNTRGSCIVLDSDDPADYVYRQSAGNQLNAFNVQFTCAQQVQGQKFFRTSATSVKQNFDNVHFVRVHTPFAWEAGTYFQCSSFRNIRFTDSGTFHSDGVGNTFAPFLVGTLLDLYNIEIEGTAPDRAAKTISSGNVRKILVDLDGIRLVKGDILIEPATPTSPSIPWLALLLRNLHDEAWLRAPIANLDRFYVEVTGAGIAESVQQWRGNARITMTSNNNVNAPHRLFQQAVVTYNNRTFSGGSNPLSDYFTFEDQLCKVNIESSNIRNFGSTLTDSRYTFKDVSLSPSGSVPIFSATAINNLLPTLLWKFDGGFIDEAQVKFGVFGGGGSYPAINATYGRALFLTPNASGSINVNFQAYTKGVLPAGTQCFIVLRATLPTFSSGTVDINLLINDANAGSWKSYTTASSGQSVVELIPLTALTDNPVTMGINISASGVTAGSRISIEQMEIYVGKSLPSAPLPSYPSVISTATDPEPQKGVFAAGDFFRYKIPTVGAPQGWTNTVDGGGAYAGTRANSTSYAFGVWQRWSTGTTVWECIVAGTSAGAAPSIVGKVVGDTVVDGGVTWIMRSLLAANIVSVGNL